LAKIIKTTNYVKKF